MVSENLYRDSCLIAMPKSFIALSKRDALKSNERWLNKVNIYPALILVKNIEGS